MNSKKSAVLVVLLAVFMAAMCFGASATGSSDESSQEPASSMTDSSHEEEGGQSDVSSLPEDTSSDTDSSEASGSSHTSSYTSSSAQHSSSAGSNSRPTVPNIGNYSDVENVGSDLEISNDDPNKYSDISGSTSSKPGTEITKKNIDTSMISKWIFIPIIFIGIAVFGLVYINYSAVMRKKARTKREGVDLSSVNRRRKKRSGNRNNRRRF